MRLTSVDKLEKQMEALPSLTQLDAEIENRIKELDRLKTLRVRIARAQGEGVPFPCATRRTVRGITTSQQVLDAFEGAGELAWWEIANILKERGQLVAADNVRRVLSQLLKAGKVEKVEEKRGYWVLAPVEVSAE